MDFISASGTGSAARTRAWAVSRTTRLAVAAVAMTMLGGAMPVANLEVDVSALRSNKGQLRLCLTADPVNFPSCVGDARAIARSVPATQHVIRFEALPRGNYAVAVIHDANSNSKLDTFAGIPREGFGFSNNPPIGFGAPRFAAARFRVEGATTSQAIAMRYLL